MYISFLLLGGHRLYLMQVSNKLIENGDFIEWWFYVGILTRVRCHGEVHFDRFIPDG